MNDFHSFSKRGSNPSKKGEGDDLIIASNLQEGHFFQTRDDLFQAQFFTLP
jgi:hypothetical protein